MGEELFRKKSIEKMRSPENIDDYIRVTNPGVWLLLAAVIVLLIGACIWGIWGHIETTLDVTATVSDGVVVCEINGSDAAEVEVGMLLCIGEQEAPIRGLSGSDGQGCTITAEMTLADGTYPAHIILERVSPSSFILN